MQSVKKSGGRKATGGVAALILFVVLLVLLSSTYNSLWSGGAGTPVTASPSELTLIVRKSTDDAKTRNNNLNVADPLSVFGVKVVQSKGLPSERNMIAKDDLREEDQSTTRKEGTSSTGGPNEGTPSEGWFGTSGSIPVELRGFPPASCQSFQPIPAPLSDLEREIIRLWNISLSVMEEMGATYWPTDATLLGLMRNGRVATDRDIDFQIHSTRDKCHGFLNSLKPYFAKRASLQSFKVVDQKTKSGKIGRYAMVRIHRKYGTFSTGVDFNCVYTDDSKGPHFFTHKGVYTPVPQSVFPLGKCMFYGHEVPCPKDGYSVLETLKPRYDGCMVFPHCLGDPKLSSRKCMCPHPKVPMASFVANTKQLDSCSYTSLAAHLENEPSCEPLLKQGERLAENKCEGGVCFLQAFKG